jgi:rod shape-determining protein MreD
MAYLILVYIALGMQVGLSPFVLVGGAPPNFVLLAVLFVALNAPRQPALLGCFGLGLMQDLLTQQTLGVYALSYGLVAVMAMSSQQFLYRDHPLTHVLVALFAAIVVASVILLHGLLRLPPERRIDVSRLVSSTLYTTVLSPFVLGMLQRIRKMFGFHARRARTS